jgi:hypothetical protein
MKLQDTYITIIIAASTAVSGGVLWLIRTVLTNQKKIALLEQSTETISLLLREVRDDQKEIRRDLQNLASR